MPPARNRRVILKSRPLAIPQAGDFEITETDCPEPEDGQFLVRNIYLSVDPAQRGWASTGTNYRAAAVLGETMVALAVGVITKTRHAAYAAGTYVYGWLGWQDYAVIGPSDVLTHIRNPSVGLSAYAGVLGINGLTAYLAFNSLGRPAAGQTVLVSTAAGAVGSVVGQLAKSAGCNTIGLTGSDEKAARCVARFGYDRAYNYHTTALESVFAGAKPVDIFFDNTGGSILDIALRHMAVGGRVVQCGTASIPNWSPGPTGLRNEREVLTRRLCWGGFVIFDHIAKFEATMRLLEVKLQDGEIVFDEDIDEGIERAPSALARVYNGENRGKKLVFLG